jgi:long-chain fatty acid transport protein
MSALPSLLTRPPATLAAAVILAAGLAPATPAAAAGIERIVPSARILFREGTYAEFNLAVIRPVLRGRDADLTALGAPLRVEGRTDDLFETYSQASLALRGDITDLLSYALYFDEPWGADTRYGRGTFPPLDFGAMPPGFSYEGTIADVASYAFTTVLAYDVMPNVKIYGGLRAQRSESEAAVPFVGPTAGRPGYTLTTDRDWSLGYMLGAGYSLPEIALNVSLTYYSRIEHTFATTEFGTDATSLTFETPQAVNLEFQSGVAADTLVFGSVRWVDWTSYVVAPPSYVAVAGAPLVEFESDWWTYTLGVGRRFTDQWSGALQASHEPSQGGTLTTLGPVDGRTILGAALTYTTGPLELTGGLSYGWLGSARNVLDTRFADGTATGFGLRIGYSF